MLEMLYTLFLICSVLGGTLFICMFFLQLFGLSGHGTTPHHYTGGPHTPGHGLQGHTGGHLHPAQHSGFRGHVLRCLGGRHASVANSITGNGGPSQWLAMLQSWIGAMVSFQGIVVGITAFGLVGMAGLSQGWTAWLVLPLACAACVAASFLVAAALHILLSMDSDGTLHTDDLIGAQGKVYLSVPGGNSGLGKVVVTTQGRTEEFNAVTYQPVELKAGDEIIVVGVQKPGILEVSSAASVPTQLEL